MTPGRTLDPTVTTEANTKTTSLTINTRYHSMASHKFDRAYYTNAAQFKRGIKTELRILVNKYLKTAAKKKFIVDSKQRIDLIWTNFNIVLLQRYHEIAQGNANFQNPTEIPSKKTLSFAAELIFEFAVYARHNDIFGYSPSHRTRGTKVVDRLSFYERNRHEIDDAFGRRVAREFAADYLKLFFNHFFTGYRQLRTHQKMMARRSENMSSNQHNMLTNQQNISVRKSQHSRSSEGSGHWSGSKSFSSTGRGVY